MLYGGPIVFVYPDVAQAGTVQRQGAGDAAVVIDGNPLAMRATDPAGDSDPDGSGLPARGTA